MKIKDIENLAHLARIGLSEEEKATLLKDSEEILAFVDEVQKVDVSMEAERRLGVPYNVVREDTNPHDSGIYTDTLLGQAPRTKDGYVMVKKIL